MKRRLIIAVISMMMLGGAAFLQSADAKERGMWRGGHGMNCDEDMPGMTQHRREPMWGHLKNLGLDDKQKTEIREIRDKAVKQTIRMKADERIARMELRELLSRDAVDMTAVRAKLKQMESLMTEIHLARIAAREEIKSKLTPEQRKKFREGHVRRSFMRGPMRGDGGHMMMPWSKDDEEMEMPDGPGGPANDN
jgi:Spy/CpxP family protein refolding chaperone